MPRAKTNGIEIEYDTLGSAEDPAILLVMGFALQMTRWQEGLKRRLADAGFRVIWFDNRDVGLSTEFTQYAPPSPMDVLTAVMTGQDASKLVPYTVKDMAADAAGLLDAIGVDKADILGVSMGGMIAQHLALDHAHKVRKLIPVMTSSGDPSLPPSTPEAMAALTAVPAARTPHIAPPGHLPGQRAGAVLWGCRRMRWRRRCRRRGCPWRGVVCVVVVVVCGGAGGHLPALAARVEF